MTGNFRIEEPGFTTPLYQQSSSKGHALLETRGNCIFCRSNANSKTQTVINQLVKIRVIRGKNIILVCMTQSGRRVNPCNPWQKK